MEVRFVDKEGVKDQVRTAVEDALLEEGLLRSSAPRGRSQPEQTDISPERSERSESVDASESASSDRPTAERTDGQESTTASSTGPSSTSDETVRSGDSNWSAADAGAGEESPTGSDTTAPSDEQTADSATAPSDRKFSGDTDQSRLGDDPETTHETLPTMRILGQLHDTYVVAETDDGLVLIDQHAADERVNYERLREKFDGETTTQALADPVEIELTPREVATFEERTDALASLGFHTARTGERTIEVRTLPGVIADAAGPEIVRDVLGAFVGGESEAATTVEAAADELLGDLACYPSVTGNTSLTEGSVRELLSALDDCENPYACPHGRPTVIEIDVAELEDRFERDYPGHAGRRD